MKKIFLLGGGVCLAMLLFTANAATAAVSGWQKAASINPRDANDFRSDSFHQSVQDLKAIHANTVSLIVPYYTSNCQSSDVQAGWNTPSAATLTDAINYIHGQGMRVNLTPHLEAYDTWGGICGWRANISPSDRNNFFLNYGNMIKNLAALKPDELTIGAELISLSSNRINPDNTTRWKNLIASVRSSAPTVRLTYSANWGSGDFATETNQIQFWGDLDTIGVSGYYEHWTPSAPANVSEVVQSWSNWDNSNIKPLNTQFGKPVEFTEIGYQSTNDARQQPWNYDYKWYKGYNGTEQANLYEALFQYWNNQNHLTGINIWDWSSDPNAGGPGNTDYTPQNKPAEAVIAKWFGSGAGTNPTPTPPPVQANFAVSAAVSPAPPKVNESLTISGRVVNNSSGSQNNIIVDIEIYDSNDNKIFQKFFEGENFSASQTRTFTASWTPTSTGSYKVAMGIFNSNWTQNHLWNGSVASFSVATGTTNPTPTPTPAPTPGMLDIWWPGNGVSVQGVQPFKAMIENMNIAQYQMYWQVDGDTLNLMDNSPVDYPHKESLVDLSGWTWRSDNTYTINFVAKDLSGKIIGQKSISIHVAH